MKPSNSKMKQSLVVKLIVLFITSVFLTVGCTNELVGATYKLGEMTDEFYKESQHRIPYLELSFSIGITWVYYIVKTSLSEERLK